MTTERCGSNDVRYNDNNNVGRDISTVLCGDKTIQRGSIIIRCSNLKQNEDYSTCDQTTENTCFLGFFFDILSSAMMTDLTITFISRLKMGAKCANQQ